LILILILAFGLTSGIFTIQGWNGVLFALAAIWRLVFGFWIYGCVVGQDWIQCWLSEVESASFKLAMCIVVLLFARCCFPLLVGCNKY